MEPKEDTTSGDTPSNYHGPPRNDAVPTGQTALALPCREVGPIGADMAGIMQMKKRGRPRKYGPDGSVHKSYLPKPVSASAPPQVGNYSSGKRDRGRSGFSEANQQENLQMVALGDDFGRSDGANFTPHVITVNVGEDITAKIISFCQQGPRGICILSANGTISNATLRQSDSSGGTLTYEGRFEIVNLCGSFTPTEREGTRYREGGLSVSLSSPNGQVVGGCVAGLLIAASPIQIIVGSFLPSTPPEVKPKKPKVQQPPSGTPSPFTITSAPPSNVDKESSCNGQGHNNNNNNNNNSVAPMQNLASPTSFQQPNWSNTQAMSERRVSITDINISLPGGMQ